jgi:hypothetical protein
MLHRHLLHHSIVPEQAESVFAPAQISSLHFTWDAVFLQGDWSGVPQSKFLILSNK